jgi:hypothetical protein
VSQCWDAFTDDLVYEAQIQKHTCMMQGTLKNINSFACSSIQGSKLGLSRDKGRKSKKQLFPSAKVCLLSLKRTLEDLHQKDLFPYNPKPLLKRSVPMMFFSPLSSVIYCFASTFACFIKYLYSK